MNEHEYQAAIAKLTDEQLAGMLVTDFMNQGIAEPQFCAFLRTEADIRGNENRIPLVYVWNENRQKGSFTVSVNGAKVAQFLEAQISRDNPRFSRVRDMAINVMAEAANNTLLKVCQKARMFPSQLCDHAK